MDSEALDSQGMDSEGLDSQGMDSEGLDTEPRTALPDTRARWAEVAMVAVLLAWASAFVGVRAVAPHLDPGATALGRLLVALPPVALLVRRPWSSAARARPTRPRGRAGAMVVLYGVLWFAGYNVVLNTAGAHIDAGTAAMLVNVGPLVVAVLAGVLLDEGFPPPLLAGLAVAFVGVVVIGTSGGERSGSPLGVALALAAAGLYATGVLAQKVALRSVDPGTATLAGLCVGAVALLPRLPALIGDVRSAPPSALAWLLYLGMVPTALGFSLWAFVLRYAPAGRTASATLAVPALAVLISWALLSELPTVGAMVGGVIALIGVAISRRRTPA